MDLLQKSPLQLKTAQAKLEQETGKYFCSMTLKRALKKEYSLKRIRCSLKDRRDEEDFRNTQGMLSEFSRWEKEGRSELYYFDESGFSQRSSLPYAWSPIGVSLEVPAYSHSRRLNVLGFLSQQGKLFYHSTTERVTADIVVEAFKQFIEQKDPESFIVIALDSASMHRAKKFRKACYDCVNKRALSQKNSQEYRGENNILAILRVCLGDLQNLVCFKVLFLSGNTDYIEVLFPGLTHLDYSVNCLYSSDK